LKYLSPWIRRFVLALCRWARARKGREDDAALQFREVIARDSGYVGRLLSRKELLARTGHDVEARDDLSKGLSRSDRGHDQRTRAEIQEALDALN